MALCTRGWGGGGSNVKSDDDSSAKIPDFDVRSPDFLTKNWPLTIFPIFPTYSQFI